MPTVSQRLMKGSLWVSLARALVNLLAFVSTFVLARLLVPADFGLVALATTILTMVTAVTEIALGQALIRHPDPQESHFSAAWTLNVARAGLLFLFFVAIAWPMAVFYAEPRLVPIMAALGASVFVGGFVNPRRVMLQRQLIFRQEFTLSVAQKLAGVLASILVAAVWRSYWALVVGAIVTQLVNVLVSYTVLPFRPRLLFAHVRELLSFSVWLTAGQIVNTLNWRFDYLLVGKFLPAATLGFYSVGSNLAQTPTRETTLPLTQPIFPAFAHIAHDPPRLAAAYQRAQAVVTAVALPMGIGTALVADPLIRLTMGEKWVPVIFVVQILASVFALQTLGTLVQPLGMALGQTRMLFVRSAQMLLVRVPIIAAGMLLFGWPGLLVARAITGTIGTLVDMAVVRRLVGLPLHRQLAVNARAIAAVLAMAAGVSLLQSQLAAPHGTSALVGRLLLLAGSGALLSAGATLMLWQLAGRPNGPESEIGGHLRALLSRLRRRRGSRAS